MKFKSGWHVLYVKSCHEKKVYDLLLESGVVALLPMTKKVRTWSDRKKTILQPLFTSYVFVNILSIQDFHKVLSINGACAYIRFGTEYALIMDSEINKIRLLVESQEISDIELVEQMPKKGDIKKIFSGSLIGLECEVISVNNVNKIIVRIDSLYQNIIATLPINYFSETDAYSINLC